jgi:hypothetical protein
MDHILHQLNAVESAEYKLLNPTIGQKRCKDVGKAHEAVLQVREIGRDYMKKNKVCEELQRIDKGIYEALFTEIEIYDRIDLKKGSALMKYVLRDGGRYCVLLQILHRRGSTITMDMCDDALVGEVIIPQILGRTFVSSTERDSYFHGFLSNLLETFYVFRNCKGRQCLNENTEVMILLEYTLHYVLFLMHDIYVVYPPCDNNSFLAVAVSLWTYRVPYRVFMYPIDDSQPTIPLLVSYVMITQRSDGPTPDPSTIRNLIGRLNLMDILYLIECVLSEPYGTGQDCARVADALFVKYNIDKENCLPGLLSCIKDNKDILGTKVNAVSLLYSLVLVVYGNINHTEQNKVWLRNIFGSMFEAILVVYTSMNDMFVLDGEVISGTLNTLDTGYIGSYLYELKPILYGEMRNAARKCRDFSGSDKKLLAYVKAEVENYRSLWY